MSATFDAAKRYAGRGWRVLPVKPGAKVPLTAHGLHDASADIDVIGAWWRRWPDANVGIATGAGSGLVVLDIDGDDGAESLRTLEREHGALPTTASVVTPRGGTHFFFQHPGSEVRCSAGVLGVGLDVRADGGYVVAPPSAGANGGHYEVDELAPVAVLPRWLLELLGEPRRNGTSPVAAEVIPAGRRNVELTSVAGAMRRRGLVADEIAGALAVVNAKRCRPPLPAREVEQIAASVARYEPAVNGVAPAATSADGKKKGGLELPPTPAIGDVAGHCRWLTAVFALDPEHPITGGKIHGHHGPDAAVVLERAGRAPLRFEPARHLNSPLRTIEAVTWCCDSSDGAVPDLKGAHCRAIAHVVRMLCEAEGRLSAAEEILAIVGAFQAGAIALEGHTTYGSPSQRYEAAVALRRELDEHSGRPVGPPRYLVDGATGELVVRASDLQDAARRFSGSSLARGWVDSRMREVGWERCRLDGHAIQGREGRTGPHARVEVYRGLMPAGEGDDASHARAHEDATEGEGAPGDHVTTLFPTEYARAESEQLACARTRRGVEHRGHVVTAPEPGSEVATDELVAAFVEAFEAFELEEPVWVDRYISAADAAQACGVPAVTLLSRRRKGELHTIGMTGSEQRAARKAAGWDKVGVPPGVSYLLSELHGLYPDMAEPPPPTIPPTRAERRRERESQRAS